MVPWPSGKAKVCKTFIRQFKSGRYLHVEKPRFLDNFVENEVLRLLEPVAEQRVYTRVYLKTGNMTNSEGFFV